MSDAFQGGRLGVWDYDINGDDARAACAIWSAKNCGSLDCSRLEKAEPNLIPVEERMRVLTTGHLRVRVTCDGDGSHLRGLRDGTVSRLGGGGAARSRQRDGSGTTPESCPRRELLDSLSQIGTTPSSYQGWIPLIRPVAGRGRGKCRFGMMHSWGVMRVRRDRSI